MKKASRAVTGIATIAATGIIITAFPGCGKANGEASAVQKDAAKAVNNKDAALTCNGDSIAFAELDTLANAQIKAYIEKGMGMEDDAKEEALNNLRRSFANMFLQKILLTQEAKRRGIEVTDADIQAELAKIEDMAKSQGKTLDQLIEESPMPKEFLMNNIRDGVHAQKLFAKIKDEFKVAAEDVAAAKAKIVTAAAALEKITGIKKQLADGADFAELARLHSTCPSGKRDGGTLGTFGKGMMVKPFEDAAFGLEVGVVSDVVTTQFGLHLVKVTAKDEEAGTVTASHILISVDPEQTEEEIIEKLREPQVQQAVMELFTRLQNEAKIECNLPGVVFKPGAGLVSAEEAQHEHGENCDHE